MSRFVHIAGSFVIVLVAYWTYRLVAVPLIEPPLDPRHDQEVSPEELGAARDRPRVHVQELTDLFPPGAWELQDPKILESDQVKVLIRNYETKGDGWVELDRLTMIFLPDTPGLEQAERLRQSVVMEVPQGARLRFDKVFDPQRLKIGRPVEGKLLGPVTIRSGWKLPGAEDDLLVTTQNVELSEREVWTVEPVDFRWGRHYGRGRDMHIKLLPSDAPSRSNKAGPNVGGIESFEVRTVERLHLDPGKTSPQKLAAPQPGTAPGPALSKSGPSATGLGAAMGPPMPIEVTCRGPFVFNMVQQVATFKNQVDVLRIRPSGPSDRLSCELLSIFFTQAAKPAKPTAAAAAAAAAGAAAGKDKPRNTSFDLQPQRLEAQGQPAVLSAPSDKIDARGERLEYDLLMGRMVLDGSQEVFLQQGPNEIHGRSLQYDAAAPGQLGKVLARGPGWIRGHSADRPDQQLEARWTGQLQVRPEQQNQVISLTGGAELKFQGIGQLNAREIHFWLLELPAQDPAARRRMQPDRLLARGDVRMNSPQLTGVVEQAEVWFEQGDIQGGGAHFASGPVGKSPVPREDAPRPPQDTSTVPQENAPVSPKPPQERMEVYGRLLRVRAIGRDQQYELTELTVEDGARFQGPGLSLAGPNIHLHRGTNRLWVDGAGQMTVPIDRDMDGNPLTAPSTLNIEWQRKMEFDGLKAVFEDHVIARGPTQQLRAPTMEVQLQQPIRFSDAKPQPGRPEVEQIFCRGGVSMENRTVEKGQQVSLERMEVPDLAINRRTGVMTAGGPGWLISVRQGSGNALQNQFGPPGAAGRLPFASAGRSGKREGGGAAASPVALPSSPPSPPSSSLAPQLTCLHLRFQGSITGNVLRREMTFHDRVRAAYGPADSWMATLESELPEKLDPNGNAVVLHSDHLSVTDMTPKGSNTRDWEMRAIGNVVVDGMKFTARAFRMSYDQAKDMLVLEGDGRSDARLFLQQHGPGTPYQEFAAQSIQYWPKTQAFKTSGVRGLQFNQLPGGPWKVDVPGVSPPKGPAPSGPAPLKKPTRGDFGR